MLNQFKEKKAEPFVAVRLPNYNCHKLLYIIHKIIILIIKISNYILLYIVYRSEGRSICFNIDMSDYSTQAP